MAKEALQKKSKLQNTKDRAKQISGNLLTSKSITTAVVIGAAAMSGCGDRTHDDKTEAALKGKIQPAMVDIAKQTIKESKDHPGFVTKRTKDGKITLTIDNYSDRDGDQHSVDVTMGTLPDGKLPDPKSVESVQLWRFDSYSGEDAKDGNLDEIVLVAPGGNPQAEHPGDWYARDIGQIQKDGEAEEGFSHSFDTEELFVAKNYGFDSAGPVGTAKYIVHKVPKLYDEIVADVEHPER